MQKRADIHMQLHRNEESTTFDEKAIRTLTARLADNVAETVISRVSARSRINAALTPSQRDLVKKMQAGEKPLPYPPPDQWNSE